MATKVSRGDLHGGLAALAAAHNALKAQIGAGTNFHLDAYETTVTAANATDLPTAIALTKQLSVVVSGMLLDTVSHKVVDTTDALLAASAFGSIVDLPSVIAALNDIKAKFNVHIASTTYHYTADATNAIAATNASDLASSLTLANAAKTAINAHLASAPAAASLRVVNV